MTDIDPFVLAHDYHPQDENLNDQMTPEQREAWEAHMSGYGDQPNPIQPDGSVIILDTPTSVQSVEEALRRRAEEAVDNYIPFNQRHGGDDPRL